jgi:hypothetical protein
VKDIFSETKAESIGAPNLALWNSIFEEAIHSSVTSIPSYAAAEVPFSDQRKCLYGEDDIYRSEIHL